MIIRGICKTDLGNLGNLEFPNSFPIDNLSRALDTYVAVSKGEIIALGQLNPLVELVFMQDKRRSKSERVKAFRALMIEGMFLAKNAGYPQLEAFVDDDFSKILKKHYNFKDIIGKGLTLEL